MIVYMRWHSWPEAWRHWFQAWPYYYREPRLLDWYDRWLMADAATDERQMLRRYLEARAKP